jgi:hypothetical protein
MFNPGYHADMGKPHDDAAKRQARQVYETRGAQAASDATGIPVRTIRHWAREESWPRHLAVAGEQEQADRSARQSAAATLGWATRRRRAADEFGETAMRALARLQAELAKSRPRGIQPLAMAAVMLAKQAEEQLAAVGGHGRRDMSPEASVVRITELLDAIEPRAAGDG